MGWRMFINGSFGYLRNTIDFFSIGSLFRTFFSPFRQISANSGFLDRMLSRFIGAMSRFGIILVGSVATFLEMLICLVLVIIWPLLPFLPIVCVVLTVMGVGNV